MNSRNGNFIQRYNKRSFYPNADSKVTSKQLAQAGGIPTPDLYHVVDSLGEIKKLPAKLRDFGNFVIKPEHGSGGEGVMVLGVNGDQFETAGGDLLSFSQIRIQVANTLSGLYSLGGQIDRAVFEERVEFDPRFKEISYRGVPDVRIIVFLGVPVMAMTRLPTKSSQGRANLHQGAIGVGVQIVRGETTYAVQGSSRVETHPDTGKPVTGVQIPSWDKMLEMAARSSEMFGLNYLGVDIVLDKNKGPLLLEVNVRPGLAIQLANRMGLLGRLKKVEEAKASLCTLENRLRFSKEQFN